MPDKTLMCKDCNQNSSSLRASRLFTRKRDSKMSHRGALNAGEPERRREETAASETSQETAIPPATGGKPVM